MNRYQLTRKIAVLGIAANIFLLGFKLFAGFVSNSQAMIADGFNSAGDVFASLMTLIGNKIASQPEDKNHPYGHGKAEYIFSMIISFSLLAVALVILRNSLEAILHRKSPSFSWWLIGVAVVTIVIKIILFFYSRRAGLRENSLLILANAEDHRNDVFVTSATLLGVYFSIIGIYWADGAVGIGISLWIGFTAVRIFLSAYNVLMDTNIDDKLKADVAKTIKSVKGVDHIDDIAAKPVGMGYIIIVKVSVNGDLTVNESHTIAAQIRKKVRKCKNIKDVVVHVNPA